MVVTAAKSFGAIGDDAPDDEAHAGEYREVNDDAEHGSEKLEKQHGADGDCENGKP
jgi:hypothetical protein